MRTGWMLTAAGFACLFLVFGIQSLDLPLLDAIGPGPGFFPLAICAIGICLAVLLAIQVWRAFEAAEKLTGTRADLMRLGALLGILAIAAAMFEPVGYTLTVLALAPAVLVLLGARSVPAIGAVSIVLSLGVFHVFYNWLHVPLPVGLFGI